TVHSNSSNLLKDAKFRAIITAMIKRIYPRHVVVAPSRGVVDDLRERFGVRSARLIYHGVHADRIARLADEPADDIPNDDYIVAVGRLTAAKDYPTMLRAYALARDEGVKLSLVIVGGGEEQAALEHLIGTLGLNGH